MRESGRGSAQEVRQCNPPHWSLRIREELEELEQLHHGLLLRNPELRVPGNQAFKMKWIWVLEKVSPSTSRLLHLSETPRPMSEQQPIALLSVYDKAGLLPFAQGLAEQGVRLLGSGGTAKAIRNAGMDIGYVFTLHRASQLWGRRRTSASELHDSRRDANLGMSR